MRRLFLNANRKKLLGVSKKSVQVLKLTLGRYSKVFLAGWLIWNIFTPLFLKIESAAASSESAARPAKNLNGNLIKKTLEFMITPAIRFEAPTSQPQKIPRKLTLFV